MYACVCSLVCLQPRLIASRNDKLLSFLTCARAQQLMWGVVRQNTAVCSKECAITIYCSSHWCGRELRCHCCPYWIALHLPYRTPVCWFSYHKSVLLRGMWRPRKFVIQKGLVALWAKKLLYDERDRKILIGSQKRDQKTAIGCEICPRGSNYLWTQICASLTSPLATACHVAANAAQNKWSRSFDSTLSIVSNIVNWHPWHDIQLVSYWIKHH